MNKVVQDADAAVRDIQDGSSIMVSGFGLCGIPENLLQALRRQGAKDLTVISNNAGTNDFGITWLLQNGQVRKMISTYVGENKVFEKMALAGELEVELNPQGTFAERMRAGGAGVPAFFTPTGYGTLIAEGKEVRWFGGRPHVLEPALRADYAFLKAWKADTLGNLVYRRTTRNFAPVMAMAARCDDRRVRTAGRGRQPRPRPGAHPRHLREARVPGRALRKAHREAHAAHGRRSWRRRPGARAHRAPRREGNEATVST